MAPFEKSKSPSERLRNWVRSMSRHGALVGQACENLCQCQCDSRMVKVHDFRPPGGHILE